MDQVKLKRLRETDRGRIYDEDALPPRVKAVWRSVKRLDWCASHARKSRHADCGCVEYEVECRTIKNETFLWKAIQPCLACSVTRLCDQCQRHPDSRLCWMCEPRTKTQNER